MNFVSLINDQNNVTYKLYKIFRDLNKNVVGLHIY